MSATDYVLIACAMRETAVMMREAKWPQDKIDIALAGAVLAETRALEIMDSLAEVS